MNHLRESTEQSASPASSAPSLESAARQPSARGASGDPRFCRRRDRLRRRRRLVSAEPCPLAARAGIAGRGWARWTRPPRSTTRAMPWRSRSSRSSASTCRSSRWGRTWSRRSSRSRIGASTIITASMSSASCRRRCRTSGTWARVQGASTITQQLARTSFLTPDKTYSRKLQELILAGAHRAHVLEGPDPRAVSQQGVLRRRPVRRRSGVARLLREARRPTSRWRRRRCSPGS